jgi:hypothetical protein
MKHGLTQIQTFDFLPGEIRILSDVIGFSGCGFFVIFKLCLHLVALSIGQAEGGEALFLVFDVFIICRKYLFLRLTRVRSRG